MDGPDLNVDPEFLISFENGLNPADPHSGSTPVEILGYGEMSATFVIGDRKEIAFKRMPPFDSEAQAQRYLQAVYDYLEELEDASIGVKTTPCKGYAIVNREGEHIVYIAQPRLGAETIGNARLAEADEETTLGLLDSILQRLIAIERSNRKRGESLRLGMDGQISNWSFDAAALAGDAQPVYLDITTPLMRVGGKERLEPEVFLKSVPSFLVWLVRWAFLDQVLDRYYDLRLVLIDLVANFHKEKQEAKIDAAIAFINRRLAEEATDLAIKPVAREAVDRYYREDARIWALFLAFRRLDRFIKTKLLGKKYNFILPGKIQR